MNKNFFPIRTDTACRYKWSWSTLYLNGGTTGSCHRASVSEIPDQFDTFHNTPQKIKAREIMLQGQWPGDGCEYCREIENQGGRSERQFANQIPDVYDHRLDLYPTTTSVDPAILEVFFTNTCNLKCVYCSPRLSSSIQAENLKFGGSIIPRMQPDYPPELNQYQTLIEKFWTWFVSNSHKLKRFHFLGGEPFLQKDYDLLIDYFDRHPHPDLEFAIVSNLCLPESVIRKQIKKLESLIRERKIKRVEICASVDCWGDAQEYVRFGFQQKLFEKNLKTVLHAQHFRVSILSVLTTLTIPYMPLLLEKYREWKQINKLCWYFNLVVPIDQTIFCPTAFDFSLFETYLDHVCQNFPDDNWDDQSSLDILSGMCQKLKGLCRNNIARQQELLLFLRNNDQRRQSDWTKQFPWLATALEANHVV